MELADIARFSPSAQRQILEQLGQTAGKVEKPGKYHSRKCTVTLPESGRQISFDSEREARRFGELRMLLRCGQIQDLRLQVNFTLQEGYTTADGERVRPIVYRADFTYRERTGDGWCPVVEDVKGVRTKEYNTKRKMMLGKFGVKIREV